MNKNLFYLFLFIQCTNVYKTTVNTESTNPVSTNEVGYNDFEVRHFTRNKIIRLKRDIDDINLGPVYMMCRPAAGPAPEPDYEEAPDDGAGEEARRQRARRLKKQRMKKAAKNKKAKKKAKSRKTRT